jgi:hypothetical protein
MNLIARERDSIAGPESSRFLFLGGTIRRIELHAGEFDTQTKTGDVHNGELGIFTLDKQRVASERIIH